MNSPTQGHGPIKAMTLSQLRHDIRNYLNAIKLSCALLQRRHSDEMSVESMREIDRSADGINDLVNRCLSDERAWSMLDESRKSA